MAEKGRTGTVSREVLLNAKASQKRSARTRLRRSASMYAMLVPGVALVLLFAYTPMYGLIIGFKDYNIFAGANPVRRHREEPVGGAGKLERAVDSEQVPTGPSSTRSSSAR